MFLCQNWTDEEVLIVSPMINSLQRSQVMAFAGLDYEGSSRRCEFPHYAMHRCSYEHLGKDAPNDALLFPYLSK